MLSISQLRQNLFPIFHLMHKTGNTFEVVYKGTVYDLSVRRTNKVPALERMKRTAEQQLIQVETTECPICTNIVFNGVCMNSKCAK